jgi:hypothetical protein
MKAKGQSFLFHILKFMNILNFFKLLKTKFILHDSFIKILSEYFIVFFSCEFFFTFEYKFRYKCPYCLIVYTNTKQGEYIKICAIDKCTIHEHKKMVNVDC